MSELKVCPFCGGKAEIISFPVFDTTGGRIYSSETADKKYYVQCKSCATQCGALEYDTPDKAITAWNRRAQPDNPPSPCENCIHDGFSKSGRYLSGWDNPCYGCRRNPYTADNYAHRKDGDEG
jgi:Lar family restriction alleviation protein